MKITTLCYISNAGRTLMLHRTKKKNDPNAGKWIGVGGKLEEGEAPEDCLVREVREETGLEIHCIRFCGLVTFVQRGESEYMCLFTAQSLSDTLRECDEGELEWIDSRRLDSLPMWEGDRIFFDLIRKNEPFFSLKLCYGEDDSLKAAYLNGKRL